LTDMGDCAEIEAAAVNMPASAADLTVNLMCMTLKTRC
jgi:hypothetical protein